MGVRAAWLGALFRWRSPSGRTAQLSSIFAPKGLKTEHFHVLESRARHSWTQIDLIQQSLRVSETITYHEDGC